ncbi:SOH1-domain-containing protein [Sphaerosporella brunnea]|uniref:Mediator of RNA polymerase II transcription subunit 31 n=1 Tax=Sphaerosporella brunnea TaxID=1250544 RepID=A0A5J5F7M6_9PEZI|nr:SOH1-domain-containing protein [Sphaerosporella brunnea]
MAAQPQLLPQPTRTRLEIELEFVQCLANPFYLNYLAHTKVLDDERFIRYIEYLEYFRQPEYAKLLTYPVYSLRALTLLKQPRFRMDIANPGLAQEMVQQMVTSFLPAPRTPPPAKENGTAIANGAASVANSTST